MPGAVRVRNLSRRYGAVPAIDGVGLEIAPGEVFGLLGPNGAGKTTTVECILGLIVPDAGDIEVCGIDARVDPRAARTRIGAVLQATGLQDKIAPREALEVFGALYSAPVSDSALLERFGLADKADAAFETLSGGQKQRLALALAFVGNPKVLVLDEPTAGLDPAMRREFHDHIHAMKQDGRAVLLTTHDMDEAEQLCDRVAVLARGRIVATGAPRELIAGSRAATRVTIETSAPLDRAWLPGTSNVVCDGASTHFTTNDLTRTLAEMAPLLEQRGIAITGLKAGRASLEDVIVELTGGRS